MRDALLVFQARYGHPFVSELMASFDYRGVSVIINRYEHYTFDIILKFNDHKFLVPSNSIELGMSALYEKYPSLNWELIVEANPHRELGLDVALFIATNSSNTRHLAETACRAIDAMFFEKVIETCPRSNLYYNLRDLKPLDTLDHAAWCTYLSMHADMEGKFIDTRFKRDFRDSIHVVTGIDDTTKYDLELEPIPEENRVKIVISTTDPEFQLILNNYLKTGVMRCVTHYSS